MHHHLLSPPCGTARGTPADVSGVLHGGLVGRRRRCMPVVSHRLWRHRLPSRGGRLLLQGRLYWRRRHGGGGTVRGGLGGAPRIGALFHQSVQVQPPAYMCVDGLLPSNCSLASKSTSLGYPLDMVKVPWSHCGNCLG